MTHEARPVQPLPPDGGQFPAKPDASPQGIPAVDPKGLGATPTSAADATPLAPHAAAAKPGTDSPTQDGSHIVASSAMVAPGSPSPSEIAANDKHGANLQRDLEKEEPTDSRSHRAIGADESRKNRENEVRSRLPQPEPTNNEPAPIRLESTPPSSIVVVTPEEPLTHVQPEIRTSGDKTLVGVDHYAEPPTGIAAVEFDQLVTTAGSVILEGTPVVISGTYEDLAAASAAGSNKPIVFLESGLDRGQLLVDANMPPELAAYAVAFPVLHGPIARQEASVIEDPTAMQETIDTLQGLSQVFRDMPEDALRDNITRWTTGIQQGVTTGSDFVEMDLINGYLADHRDARMFGPEMMAAIDAQPAPQLIITGSDHLDMAEAATDRENPAYPEPPPAWDQYTEGLNRHGKAALQKISDIAQVGASTSTTETQELPQTYFTEEQREDLENVAAFQLRGGQFRQINRDNLASTILGHYQQQQPRTEEELEQLHNHVDQVLTWASEAARLGRGLTYEGGLERARELGPDAGELYQTLFPHFLSNYTRNQPNRNPQES